MYSVVLMTALMSTAPAPAWGCRGNCSTVYAGPYNWGYAVPTHCHSCYASPIVGYGAAGGCYGYHGGCYGGWGVFYGDPYAGCTGCYGCYGGYSCYGVPVPGIAVPVQAPVVKDPYPAVNPKKEKAKDKEEEVAPPKEKKKGGLEEGKNFSKPTRAIVRIEVPQGGKLFVDGRQINTQAGTRAFQTPALMPGETYFYDIRIEVDRQGAIAADERRVIIEPGQDVAVHFPNLRPAGTSTARVNR